MIKSDELNLASKCVQNAGNDVKEDLCIRLADKYDIKFLLEKTKAIESLGRFGELAISVIIAALGQENYSVRGIAADALGKIKSEKAVDELIASLGDENKIVRWKAAAALGEIKSEKAVNLLITALSNKNENLHWMAAIVLGKIKSEKAVDALIVALSNENKIVRWSAAYALSKIKSEKAMNALKAALNHENEGVRGSAAVALGKIEYETALDAPIAVQRDDKDKDVTKNIAIVLGKIKSEKAVDALIAALSTENETLRWRAAIALGKIKSEKAVDALIAAFSTENETLRWSAAYALGKIKSEKAVNALIAGLSHENEDVRRSAAAALGKIEYETAVDALIAAPHDDKDKDVPRNAANVLGGEIKFEKAVDTLIAALSNENEDMRRNAADELGKICTIKHKEVLTKLLESDNEFEANTGYKILTEIEKNERSKIELFKKEPDAIKKVDVSESDLKTNTAQPPDTGKIDPYNHLRIQNLIDLKKNIVLVDYGCGQGKLLMTMNSLEPSVKKNIQYTGVDISRGNLLKSEFVARKNGYYVSLNNEPEFLKPGEFYKKQILVDRVFLIHTLHEIELKYLIQAIYHISMKLRINGKILILDPNNYLDERDYVLWDEDDFKIFFSELGYDVHRYCIETNKGNRLIAADIEKVNDSSPSIEKVAEKCLLMFESKKKKLREKPTKGLSREEITKKDSLYGYISKQIDEFEEVMKKSGEMQNK